MKLSIYGNKKDGFSGHGESHHESLLCCPFCGCAEVNVVNTHSPSYWAECAGCGAKGSDGRSRSSKHPMSERSATLRHVQAFTKAFRKWNTRYQGQNGPMEIGHVIITVR